MWQNSNLQIVTKLKNSNCDQTQNLKLWQNSKTQIVKKNWKTQIFTQLKLLQNLKTQIVTKLTNTIYFSKNNLTPPKPMRFLRAAFRDLAMFTSFKAIPNRKQCYDARVFLKIPWCLVVDCKWVDFAWWFSLILVLGRL